MESSSSGCSRIFSQAPSDTPCNCDAHFGSEIKVSARSSLPRRKKKKLSCELQDGFEAASCLGDLTLASEGTNCGSQPLHHQPHPLEQTALHDHALYCIPEEAAALKNLVRKLKDTVSHQSDLLFSLQKTVENQELQNRELQEKAEAKKCHVLTDLEAHVSQLEARNQYQLEPRGPCLQKEQGAYSATILSLNKQVSGQLEDRAQHEVFSLEGVNTHSKWLRFYTGFDEYPRLKAFLDFLREGESLENGPPCALSPENQLFLVLVRLRLGLLLQDLAFRFHISESTACRYWLSWMELMERKLRQVPVAFSQRYIDAFKPQQQLRHHDMVLVALDCAELFFEAQGRTRGKRDGSRSPRAHYSIQGSALAAPSGFLTFNAGTGHELLTLPPFLQMGPVELTVEQEAAKRQVLSLHSLTDKALGFRFLRLVHPQNMEDQVRRAWVISCYLACLLHEPMGLT
ncbi:uncharacterized protein LOC117666714 isoform X2 [Pantherophis guttatus]|uniref:Uncharacterized protein LOC117666714 isoform X2 n=1 Tax=Pantherophis guttatus TaxID=94885 RepID=A0A6P9BZ49_PANGU|nr:uncharacterized protein LOC117666714 isoform X2 [Pantherophis guttatus]